MSDLVEYAAKQRWFRSKARARTGAKIVGDYQLLQWRFMLLRFDYEDGGHETYAIPVDAQGNDAFADPEFLAAFLRSIKPDAPRLPARLVGVEQTNSSIIYGDRYILKLYRVIDDEPSVELEVGRFLTARGFRGSPKLVGALEVEARTFAILYEFVPNRGDAWKLATEGDPDVFVTHARLLGKRTAELHAALASEPNDPAFAPEPIDAAYLGELATHVRESLARAIALVPVLASRRPAIERALAIAAPPNAYRTRTHGDYHLGQVLWTGSDFAIIDFEGEPSAPIAERREKKSPARDVAGMLRSIDYAGAVGKRERAWVARAQDAFRAGYGRFDDALVRFFTIEKALYEIAYEANNRPDWVDIPLRGLLALVEGA